MAVPRGPLLAAAALLLLCSGHLCLSPPCPDVCSCQSGLLNCSSAGLYLVPRHIPDSVSELHLSHNRLPSVALDRPLRRLWALWLDNNTIAHLSLCTGRSRGGRPGCDSWAPTLQLLSVERNLLQQLPEGLEGSASLQVLRVSFNRISTLRAEQFGRLRQLRELHLQHNLITSVHPQMFQDLTHLRVLDLSFNMLTSLHPLMHLPLRRMGAEVTLVGNKWHCDCSMRSLRRRLVHDRSRGLEAWKVVCASPPVLRGRDLLQLEESELNCFSAGNEAELHQDVTVYRGSEVLLTCSAQDSMWLTPNGQVPVGEHQAGLLISDITEGDTGLYVCVSEENNVVSVYNLQISRNKGTIRKVRSLPSTDGQFSQDDSDRSIQGRNQAANSNLALAVCLSVFITFLVAFIIGVIARPWLDVLWQRITNKNRSPEITASMVEQRQYDNQAFSCCEEPGEVCYHRERRVTFCSVDIGENSSVLHYDTTANNSQENINNYEVVKADRDAHRARDSGSETSSQSSQEGNQRSGRELSGRDDAGLSKNTKLEYIRETNELKKEIKPSWVSEESIQQRAPVPKSRNRSERSVNGSKILGFSSEPFGDWSPHAKDSSVTDQELWQQKEGQFEFSDSSHSSSSSGKNSKQTGQKKRNDKLSLNAEYTVNPQQEEDMEWNKNTPEVTKDVLKTSVRHQQPIGGGEYAVISKPGMRPKHSFSSYSSDSEEDNKNKQKLNARDEKYSADRVTGTPVNTQQKVVPLPRTKLPGSFVKSSQGHSPVAKTPTSPAVHSSSSSSESELKANRLKMKQKRNKENPRTKVQVSGNIKETSSDSESSSSGGRKIETSQVQRQEVTSASRPSFKASQSVTSDHRWPAVDLEHTTRVKRRLDIKIKSSGSQSSSSSESEDGITKQNPWQTPTTRRPPLNVSQSVGSDQQWPTIDLDHSTRVKRRLDIKAPSFKSDTTSSDSEDDRGQRPVQVDASQRPLQESQSSSSSDSEDEKSHTKKKDQWQTSTTRLPHNTSPTGRPSQQWPAVNLERTTKVKRRLDIKVTTHASDTSSSSDSEDETSYIKKQEQWESTTRLPPIELSHTGTAGKPWPAIDLLQNIRVKRRLDVKARSLESDTSSSSDSEDDKGHREEQIPGRHNHIKKIEHWETSTPRLPTKGSQIVKPDQWPAVDLDHSTRVKRWLDFKIKSPDLSTSFSRPAKVDVTQHLFHKSSSSGSDSEDDTSLITKQDQQHTSTARLPPIKVSQNISPSQQWPAIHFERTTKVKRRLDIKVTSADSESSSSSDSEDETSHITKQEQWQTSTTRLPNYTSPTGRPGQQWPAVNLERTTKVKRRLDIKASLPKSDTSSSSESEDNRDHKENQRPSKIDVTQHPIQDSPSSSSSDSEHETRPIRKQEQWQTSLKRLPHITSPSGSADQPWPAINLQRRIKVKRRLDIKVTSDDSESSSSSDSEDETSHIIKQEQWQTSTTRLPHNTSPTGRPGQQWPAVNLERTTKVKRRLDIKASLPKSDTSSSSESEDDRDHKENQRQSKIDITRHPIQDSPSSSSSDSEHETRPIRKQEQWQTSLKRLPHITSPSGSADQPWPAIHLQRRIKVKRRLDIKVTSDDSESSSSSDSEDETSHIIKQEQWQTSTTRLPNYTSPTGAPDQPWPTVNLEQTTKVKRRLDIKPSLPKSETSSSSESEDDRDHKEAQRPGMVHVSQHPIQISQSSSSSESEDETNHITKQEQWQTSTTRLPHNTSPTGLPGQQWPAVNLERTTKVKRRLDIKVTSDDSESSSSSDSEDETSHIIKQEQWQTSTTRLPNYTSPTGTPDQPWPTVNLEQTTKVKRRLDIKPSLPKSETSSSSESEDDRNHKEVQRPGMVHVSQHPIQISQSSSSSESEDETNHITKQEQWQTSTTRLPHNTSPTGLPGQQWPAVNLERTTKVKRRLDIKVTTHDSDTSSSSDSEDETSHITKQEQWQTSTTRLPHNTSPTGRPGQQWPAVNLERTTKVKRRLDIKPSLPKSDTSSSSESEDDRDHKENQRPSKIDVTRHPIQDSPSSSSSDSEHETRPIRKQEQWQTSLKRLPHITSPSGSADQPWPAINLQRRIKVKRRLDIKVTSDDSESSSSSDSEDETSHIIKQEQWQTSTTRLPHNTSPTGRPGQQWPAVNLERTTKVKRRLDIKASLPKSDTSSSSESEDDRDHKENQRPSKIDITRHPIQDSPSSSSSDSEHETRPIRKQEQWQTSLKRLPHITSPSGSADQPWPAINLQRRIKVKRRLDIKVTSADSESSSSSDSEDETSHITKQEPWQTSTTRLPNYTSPTGSSSDTSSSSESEDDRGTSPTGHPDHPRPAVNLQRTTKVKRHLDQITSHDYDSSSSSESEDEKGEHVKPGLGASIVSSKRPKDLIKSPTIPLIHTSNKPKADGNIKLEKYVNLNDTSDKTSGSVYETSDVSPELQSLWAKMSLGKSRFRKHLEITSRKEQTPNPPLSPSPISPRYTSYDEGTESKPSTRRAQVIIHTKPLLEPVDKVQKENSGISVKRERKDSSSSSDSSSSDEKEDVLRKDIGEGWKGRAQPASQTYPSPNVARSMFGKIDQPQSQEVRTQMGIDVRVQPSKKWEDSGPVQPHILTNDPRDWRTLNMRAPLQMESSTDGHRKTDILEPNIPETSRRSTHTERSLSIKEPSSSSSSSSESENETTENTMKQDSEEFDILGNTDSLITYKRSIFNSSSLLGSSTLPMVYKKQTQARVGNDEAQGPSHNQGGTEASLTSKILPSRSFGETINTRIVKSRTGTNVEVPPEIKWNGIGHRLRAISNLKSPGESAPIPRQERTKRERSVLDDSSFTDELVNIKGEVLIPTQWRPSASSNRTSSRNLFDNSPSSLNEILRADSDQRRERRGLSALKAMSSDRKKWDTQSDTVTDASPQFNGYDSPISTHFNTRSSKSRQQTQLPPHSNAGHEERVQNFLYGIPLYRRHVVATTPPPIPATPPPDEVQIPGWRSPQSSERLLGVRRPPYQRNTGESDPSETTAEHIGNPYNNISSV